MSILEHTKTINRAVVRGVFRKFNSKSDNIDISQLADVIAELGIPRSVLDNDTKEAMKQVMDSDGSGGVDFDEFYKWWSKMASVDAENLDVRIANIGKLYSVVKKFDFDKSNDLNHAEFTQLWQDMGNDMSILEDVIKKIDKDGDEKISFLELALVFGFVDGKGDLSMNYFSKIWTTASDLDAVNKVDVKMPEHIISFVGRERTVSQKGNKHNEENTNEDHLTPVSAQETAPTATTVTNASNTNISKLEKELEELRNRVDIEALERQRIEKDLMNERNLTLIERSRNKELKQRVEEYQLEAQINSRIVNREVSQVKYDSVVRELRDVRMVLAEYQTREVEYLQIEKRFEKERAALKEALAELENLKEENSNLKEDLTSLSQLQQEQQFENTEQIRELQKANAVLTNICRDLKNKEQRDSKSYSFQIHDLEEKLARKSKKLKHAKKHLSALEREIDTMRLNCNCQVLSLENEALKVQLARMLEIDTTKRNRNESSPVATPRSAKSNISNSKNSPMSSTDSPKQRAREYRLTDMLNTSHMIEECTWARESIPNTFKVSEDMLSVTSTGNNTDTMIVATQYVQQYSVTYWEITVEPHSNSLCYFGVVSDHLNSVVANQVNSHHGWALRNDGHLFQMGKPNPNRYCRNFSNQKVIVGVLLDLVLGHITFFLNGKSQGLAFDNVGGNIRPAVTLHGHTSITADFTATIRVE
jgi:hypothetical protein